MSLSKVGACDRGCTVVSPLGSLVVSLGWQHGVTVLGLPLISLKLGFIDGDGDLDGVTEGALFGGVEVGVKL